MQGPVSGTVLCIRETGDPYVILNSFPCGKKSRPLSIIVHKDTVSPPVQQDRLLHRIIQTFRVLAGKEFLLNWPPVFVWKRFSRGFFARVWMRERRGASPHKDPPTDPKKVPLSRNRLRMVGLFCFAGGVFVGLKHQKVKSWMVLWMPAAWLCHCFNLNPQKTNCLNTKSEHSKPLWFIPCA